MKSLPRLALSLAVLLTLAPPLAAQEKPTTTAEAEKPAAEVHHLEETPPARKDFGQETARLKQAIDAVLAGSDVTQGKVGIYAVDVATGQELYSRGADLALNPASNSKLITSAAALDTFGPYHTFETDLMADGVGDDGTIKGSLYVKASGDAFLLYEDFMGWAGQLRQQGVKKIDGDLVIDDTLFAGAYLPPAYGQKNEDASYRAPIGAFSVNFNAVSVVVDPGKKPGDKPHIRMVPPNDHVKIVNQATTYAGRRRYIHVASQTDGDGTKLVITGRIGDKATTFHSRRKRIDNPPLFAGAVLANALKTVGIELTGTVKKGKTPDGEQVLVVHHSQPLSYIILAMNKWSNNFMAELLLRDMGAAETTPSTWDAARKHVLAFLKDKVGLDTTTVTYHNGSGLYDANRVSPRQFVKVLRYMSKHKWAPEYMSSLSIAGDDGTLERRLQDDATHEKVRAKTGTLNNVSALSGYLHTKSGRLVAFSILFNDQPRYGWRYRPVQDRIIHALVDFDG